MAEKKTNFSLTCNLLSQYMKEKGSFGDVSLGINYISHPEPTKVLHRQPSTMSLLPGLDVGNEISGKCRDLEDKREAQLTIFYGGKVMVFDNFPAKKLNELMQMVKKDCSKVSKPHIPDRPMPIARRDSLHRFFEKRKDRINSKAPYTATAFSTMEKRTKSKNDETWLGLGQELSK